MPDRRLRPARAVACLTLMLAISAAGLTAQRSTATVTGMVTDATTQRPIQGAQVVIAGTNLSALSNQSGRYLILNAPVGTREIRVQLRWYGPFTRAVTLTAGSSSVADFALTLSVVDLEGTTVNTITGRRQRTRERGTSSGLLEVATGITPAAVTSVSDILSGRMEGLVLQDMGGTVGTAQRIRIRGAISLSLLNEPLVYLDGVRMNTNTGEGFLGVGGQEPSRLNDINPNDVASIEVLRGAAAALYGTGAANGVLLITTKRGAAGDAKWDFYAEYGQLEDRTNYPTSWVSNSIVDPTQPFLNTDHGGDLTSINTRAYPYCSNRDVADGLCAQEISQSFNNLLDYRTTPFSKGFTRKFGMSVAGGDDRTTYFISGEISDEVGVIDYNTEDKFNVRANLQTAIRSNLDAFVTFGYTASQLDLNSNDNSIFSPLINGLNGQGVFFPELADEPGQVNRSNLGFGFNSVELKEWITMQDIDRFFLGLNSSYRPLTWLTANLNMGLDLTIRHDFRTLRPEARIPTAGGPIGRRESARTNNVLYTGNGSLSAMRELNHWVVSISTAGLSYEQSRLNRTECFGGGQTAGTASCGTTSSFFRVDEDFSQEVTVGGFFQQRFAMWDRLFVSGSIRGDDNSNLGELAGWEYYPSAEVSWVVGEEGWFPTADWVGELRVRAAFGVSGLPPGFRQATPLFDPVSVSIGDEEVPGFSLGAAGNALLEPERTTEYEIGFDAGLFGDRVGLHYTYFTKTSKDVLIESRLAPSLGLTETGFSNLAQLSNSGHEIGASVTVIDRPNVGLDLDVATSFFNNEIDDLGEGTQDIIFGFRGSQRHQAGRGAGSFFQQEVFFDDADGNGKLSLSEVTLGDTAVFFGESLPTWQTSVSVGIRLWDWVRVTSLFEGRGGNAQFNFTEAFRCGFRATRGCAAVGDPNASLESQAAYLASRFLGSSAGYIEDASFIRWRELAVTLRAPASLARDIPGLDALSFTVAGRNLNIWTDYSGIDPEVVSAGGDSNFDQSEFNTQPPVRSIVFRLNYAF